MKRDADSIRLTLRFVRKVGAKIYSSPFAQNELTYLAEDGNGGWYLYEKSFGNAGVGAFLYPLPQEPPADATLSQLEALTSDCLMQLDVASDGFFQDDVVLTGRFQRMTD